MAPVSATSKITKVRLNFDPENPEAGGVFLPEIFTATKVTRTGETNTDGKGGPVYKTEVIRYDNAKGDNPVVIATSSSISRDDNRGNENYDSRLVPTENATAAEKANMGLAIRNAQLDQVRSVQDQVASSPLDNRELFKVGGNGSQTENPDAPPVSTDEAPSIPVQETSPTGNNSAYPPPPRKRATTSFIYPLDLGSSGQDTIKFSLVKREPKGSGDQRSDTKERTLGFVVLPIPGNLQDSNSVAYKQSSLNALQLAASEDIAKFITELGDASEKDSKVVTTLRNAATKNRDNAKKLIGAKAAAAALNIPGGANALISRTSGIIINPNMELLFDSPTLRSFGFSFKLSPRSNTEANQVLGIIRFFKQAMVPKAKEGNLFLGSPDSFKVEYLFGNNKPHPGLNRFKECALETVQVNYTPEGTYNSLRDGIMPSYEMELRFRELDPVLDRDYDVADETSARASQGVPIGPLQGEGNLFGQGGIGF